MFRWTVHLRFDKRLDSAFFVKIFDRIIFFMFTAGGEGCVAMVYGVNSERMNCDHLFNLFCLYGNVVKVTILTLLVCR